MPLPPFDDLLAQHAGLIHKIAWAYCRDAALRADVVQEITVQVWRACPRYDGRCQPLTWLYRIALNVAITCHRREERHRQRLQPLLADPVGAEVTVEHDDALRQLRAAIDGLSPLDRALVLLHLEGRDHATAAEVLGLSVSNVGTRLHRIKDRLRAVITAPD
ncbi:MAG: sigma-70 family RNA polymerase sigma factor [Planctomycetes bacterium]|jgi:RNA polymerase sigma-70 factor (ECF subfamily)|nr:sigma-70 family RNA polymerase sigma factor [Planctomycetota bacterium]